MKKVIAIILLLLLSGCSSEVYPVVEESSQYLNVIENSKVIELCDIDADGEEVILKFNIRYVDENGIKYTSLGETQLEIYKDDCWRTINGDSDAIYEKTGVMYINGLVFSLSDSVTVNFAPYGTMFKKGKYRIIFEIFEERALRKAESDTSSPIYLSY